MKRAIPFLALIVLAVAGCGGGGSSASSPLDEALGFLPKDAPFAVAINTDTGSGQYQNGSKILKKFPFGEQALTSFKRRLEQGNVNFNEDVKPILGNDFVVGAASPQALQGGDSSEQFVAALQAKDSGKLDELIKKDAKEKGDKNGFKIYEDNDGDQLARKDDVVVFAGSRKLLDDALETRDGDNRLTEDDFKAGLEGLPEEGVVRIYGDAERLIKSDPDSAQARKIKWVNGLRKFGAVASLQSDSIDVDFNLKTEGVSDEDLPIASGDQAPQVVKEPGEISFGLRNPAQIEKFAEAAGQAANPKGYGQFQQGKRQIEKQLNIDIDKDIVDQLTGDVAANVTPAGKFGMRAALKDPAAFEKTVAKVAPLIPRIAKSRGQTLALAKPKAGEDFYALADTKGNSVVFGVVKKNFVVANQPALAGRISTASATSVEGAEGSVVMAADAEKLAAEVLKRFSSELGAGAIFGGQFIRPLGELIGSLKSSTDGLTGKVSLSVD